MSLSMLRLSPTLPPEFAAAMSDVSVIATAIDEAARPVGSTKKRSPSVWFEKGLTVKVRPSRDTDVPLIS